MNIAVLGAGAWGTAVAIAAASRHPTHLWCRDPDLASVMRHQRRNARYLDGIELPATLEIGGSRGEALAFAEGGLVIIATPMAALREQLAALPAGAPALWLAKGFEAGTGRLGHEIARELRPAEACGVLSGPSFAQEVARGLPTALVAASGNAALREAAVAALHGEALRVYTSEDVVGVEVGGAVKNVLAIATGIVDGLMNQGGPAGLNARAALITRGLAEMTRLGTALGARSETFMGLSGLGDLVLTATGELSRNRKVGLLLAAGRTLDDAVQSLGHVAEGVPSAPTVLARARALGVEMPITEAVCEVLAARLAPREAVARLMARSARAEN